MLFVCSQAPEDLSPVTTHSGLPGLTAVDLKEMRNLQLLNQKTNQLMAYLNSPFALQHGLSAKELVSIAVRNSHWIHTVASLDTFFAPLVKHTIVVKSAIKPHSPSEPPPPIGSHRYKLVKHWPFDAPTGATVSSVRAGDGHVDVSVSLKKMPHFVHFYTNICPKDELGRVDSVAFWNEFLRLFPDLSNVHSDNMSKVKAILEKKFKELTGNAFPPHPAPRLPVSPSPSERQLLALVQVRFPLPAFCLFRSSV